MPGLLSTFLGEKENNYESSRPVICFPQLHSLSDLLPLRSDFLVNHQMNWWELLPFRTDGQKIMNQTVSRSQDGLSFWIFYYTFLDLDISMFSSCLGQRCSFLSFPSWFHVNRAFYLSGLINFFLFTMSFCTWGDVGHPCVGCTFY